MEDIQLLKAAASLLLEQAFTELKDGKFSGKNSVFGKAAPVATLEGLARLLMTLSQVENGDALPSAAMLALSDAEVALMKSLAMRARQRNLEDSQPRLPAPLSPLPLAGEGVTP